MLCYLANDPSKIDPLTVLIAVGIMLVMAIVFGFLIMVVSKKFAVATDEREETVLGCLAGANCGGCGKAGCGAFARSLVENKASIDDCAVTDKKNKEKIAEVLGIEYTASKAVKFVVACAGGKNAADRNSYVGENDCVRQNMIVGGRKLCLTACLGGGTCLVKCPQDAIAVSDDVASIDQSLCIRCGACYRACPKNVIEKIDQSAQVYIACSTKCRGKEVMDACKNGCIGCGLCAKNCPEGAIKIVNNLPEIDYNKCVACFACVERCPRKVIKKLS